MELSFRDLRADEIEVRVGTVGDGFATLLLYKDARCDMQILDETVGPLNWQRSHGRDNANCIVSIWDDDKKQWISKEDTGTESNTEAEKGLASDSFKRACVNWSIGRALYTSPRIKVGCETLADGRTYKLKNKWEFYGAEVSKISYDSGRIAELVISKDGKPIYEWTSGPAKKKEIKPIGKAQKKEPANKPEVKPAAEPKAAEQKEKTITPAMRQTLLNSAARIGTKASIVLKEIGWSGGQVTESEYNAAIELIKREMDLRDNAAANGQERI